MFKKSKKPKYPKIVPFFKSSLDIVIFIILSLFFIVKIGYLDIINIFLCKGKEVKNQVELNPP
jgi:hypothetical protein